MQIYDDEMRIRFAKSENKDLKCLIDKHLLVINSKNQRCYSKHNITQQAYK